MNEKTNDTLRIKIVSPERTLYEGEGVSVRMTAKDGRIGIRRGHAPAVILLSAGDFTVIGADGKSFSTNLCGGVAKVGNDTITVMTK